MNKKVIIAVLIGAYIYSRRVGASGGGLFTNIGEWFHGAGTPSDDEIRPTDVYSPPVGDDGEFDYSSAPDWYQP